MSTQAALWLGLVLLLGNAFFVGAEFALVSARRTKVEPKAAEGSRVARTTLRAMEELGAQRERTEVLLGPAVCGLCYEVPAEMRDEVDAALPGSAATTRLGTPSLDLRAGLRRQLAELGVTRVDTDTRCTFEDDQLFSHRRAQPTGRLAAVTWWEYPRP